MMHITGLADNQHFKRTVVVGGAVSSIDVPRIGSDGVLDQIDQLSSIRPKVAVLESFIDDLHATWLRYRANSG